MKLFYAIIGATPQGRNTEQHDVFFGIAEKIGDLVPAMQQFWPGVKLHLDAYQAVEYADGYRISVTNKTHATTDEQLFFVNLGGYKAGHFLEYHEQMLLVARTTGEAIRKSKQTEFYKTMGFPGAASHVDDKLGVDVDDIFYVKDALPAEMREKYSIKLEKTDTVIENEKHIGYFRIDKL